MRRNRVICRDLSGLGHFRSRRGIGILADVVADIGRDILVEQRIHRLDQFFLQPGTLLFQIPAVGFDLSFCLGNGQVDFLHWFAPSRL